jgi:hypothetical protein
MKRMAAVAALSTLIACGGGGGGSTPPPTVASTPVPVSGWPAGTVIQLVNGDTGAPVTGQINVGGVIVDAGTPLAAAAGPGVTVDVAVAGFLPRQTTVKTGVTKIGLWPNDSRITDSYSQSLVYMWGDQVYSLYRLPPKVRSVAVTGDFSAIPEAVGIVNAAFAPVGVTFFAGGTGDMTIPVRLDPTTSTCQEERVRAHAQFWTTNQEITRAEVTICDARNAVVETIAHELGHCFGLSHSEDQRDLMGRWYGERWGSFSEREISVIGLMMQRRGGNAWPDNDRSATSSGVRRHEVVD